MHPKFRIFRHLLILLLLGIIVMRGLFENSEFSPGWNAITLINITLIFLFWGIICLNTYILIPRLLFKGKYWTYAICVYPISPIHDVSGYFHLEILFPGISRGD